MSELLPKEGTDASADPVEYVEPRHLDLAKWGIERGSWKYAQAIWNVCVQQTAQGHFVEEKLRQRPDVTPILRRVLTAVSTMMSFPNENNMRLILEEMVMNAVRGRDKKGCPVDGRFQPAVLHYGIMPSKDEKDGKHRLLVVTEDEGKGFDLLTVPNPLHADYMLRQNGRGLQLMGASMGVRGGRLTFLPLVPEMPSDLFITRELALEFPLNGEYEQLLEMFFAWRARETWDLPELPPEPVIEMSEDDEPEGVDEVQLALV